MGQDIFQRYRFIQYLDQRGSLFTFDEHGGLHKVSAHIGQQVKFSNLSTYHINFPCKQMGFYLLY